MAEYGPLPWHVTPTDNIMAADGLLIGLLCTWPSMHANANLIVRCVNSHDDLLMALRDLCDAIPDATVAADPPLGGWVAQARAAIAKAEGS